MAEKQPHKVNTLGLNHPVYMELAEVVVLRRIRRLMVKVGGVAAGPVPVDFVQRACRVVMMLRSPTAVAC